MSRDIAEDGTFDEMMKEKGLFYDMYISQCYGV